MRRRKATRVATHARSGDARPVRGRVAGAHRDPDTDSDVQLIADNREGLLHFIKNAAGEAMEVSRLALLDEDREFIAAQPPAQGVRRNQVVQPLADRLQQEVPG